MNKVTVFLYAAGLLYFGWRRLLSYLRFFQQEEYSKPRFVEWLKAKRAYDRRGTALAVGIAILAYTTHGGWGELLLALTGTLGFLWIVRWTEEDPRTSGKIKLNMTIRATKIAYVAFGLLALLVSVPIGMSCFSCCANSTPFDTFAFLSVIFVQTPPALLMVANSLLWPAEKALQDNYYRDAQRILRETHPLIIGITGSYGKTGAKAALGDILTQCLGPTFWPKKSINTVMGITRTIRETLKPYHRYAVIEMGAYNIGSIKRLCDFTPPQAALVTAVGIMHLERFGSPENVYKAKSEIAQALPADGLLVCNGDSPGARRMAHEHKRQTTLLYGLDSTAGNLDCRADNLIFDDKGSSFTIHWQGSTYQARTPLLGRPAVSNILGAFTMACALGANPAYAAACLANLEPVDNRLVLERRSGVSYLRDAYNSNPIGFTAALEVLKTLKAQRRILMTPGMIELGDQQAAENRRLATLAAGAADIVIVVGHVNRDAILGGLSDAKFPPEKIVTVNSREDAFNWLKAQGCAGDLVLIENDLGDLHEGDVRF